MTRFLRCVAGFLKAITSDFAVTFVCETFAAWDKTLQSLELVFLLLLFFILQVQFEFCHTVVQNYIDSFSTYSNFESER